MALRLLGVPADDPALARARTFILARGGISNTRIFTKMHLALIGAYDWAGLPALPPVLMMLPERGPFSIYELSSWARGSTVPLIALFDRKPVYGAGARARRTLRRGARERALRVAAAEGRVRVVASSCWTTR